ncbi:MULTISPECIES: ribonuclease G [Acinetobacter]|uniref:Ribonuclease G n=1 Tax=Acinetobacter pollinis TaxID=2605270 RepID=A0ABU6DQ03_9GAMM|nr:MULTISPECIES: ribonuclease G [Acinetobacter]MBF7691157.1 ribonuclease G [Acinetobacter pollinis]MBF7693590.1 ribonuclease G [Acinetobacter pollinis]MBF7698830.1 ribonuclease G [Acinetobacter pollinis]MBF7699542.1 ribonuclease G [Acinetobacter pollinis]MEB5475780.1 ribonuclease G [Acinetobacter pollinis]
MSDELFINVTPMECRVALTEDRVVKEVFVERTLKRGLVGNIYKGKVVRVLPGMQAAFVDIGLSRTAFLHINDMVWPKGKTAPNVFELLQQGQIITVQVMKDMLGTKGARLTTDISLPSRYLVLMPFGNHVGISQRIESDEERERLRHIIENIKTKYLLPGSVIVRTAAEGIDELAIDQDMAYLSKLWNYIQRKKQSLLVPSLVFEELPLPQRIVRDLSLDKTEKIYVDSEDVFLKLEEFIAEFMPEMKSRLVHYVEDKPLFDLHHIEEDIQKALQIRIALKSGGYLMIDQTEAMTTIDVNTGSYVGGRSLEDTVYRTNMEATEVIGRQLRLRNLGGIIIIDFIDMQEEIHRAEVLKYFEAVLEKDHAKTKITQVSELGLIEMTRKRTRESLEHLLCDSCPTCHGRGFVKTAETVCYEIFREMMRFTRTYPHQTGFVVVASPVVIDRLLTEEATAVEDLSHLLDRTIKLQVETLYTQEQYDIIFG